MEQGRQAAYSTIPKESFKIKLNILEKGGNLYYSDTDSLVINKDFLDKDWLGKEIGKFKLEYEIKEAYFISNKTYCLLLNNDKTIIKTKGVINESITIEQFKKMYYENKNVTAQKFNSIINYSRIKMYKLYFSLYSSTVERNTVNILIYVRFILRAAETG